MPSRMISLSQDENLIDGEYQDAEARWLPNDLLVQLLGQVRHQQAITTSAALQQATKLEIHMDEAAAISLAASILDLAMTMGWPLPQLAGYRFAKP